jgi:hypothetical protein
MSKLKKLPHLEGVEDIVVPDVLVEESRDLTANDPRLKGIDFPMRVKDLDPFSKERWISCIEVMIGRGIESSTEIAALTGLSRKAAGMFKNSVLKRWGDSMTQGAANSRREKLYYETERVKAELWRKYEVGEATGADFKEQISYLKMIVDAGARQAKLCGLESQQIDATITAGNKSSDQMQEEAALTISADKLALIGKLLASEIGAQDDNTDD